MKNGLITRVGLVLLALAAALQVNTSFNISVYTYGLTTDPAQGLQVAGPMFIGLIASAIFPVAGGIFAAVINIPGFFVSWIGTAGGDPWMANKAFSQATFVNVAIYYAGLGWFLFRQRKARRTAG